MKPKPTMKTIHTTPYHHHHHDHSKNLTQSQSPASARSRNHRRHWRQSRLGTAVVAVVALLISTAAWLSLVFSGTTTHCWNRLKDWEAAAITTTPHSQSPPPPSPPPPPNPYSLPYSSHNRSNQIAAARGVGISSTGTDGAGAPLSLKHVVFGIAGSSRFWKRRKEIVRLWWRPGSMRGHVWLEEQVSPEEGDESLPPTVVSEDISRFRYTNPTGHPSGLRIARIVAECFSLRLPNVRWFVMGDDDTVFNADNLVAVLSKYDPSEMVYIGSSSESHSANTYFSHFMAYGGAGIAISYSLAATLSMFLDECVERYPKLYGSDDRLHACITELGVPLTRELGFHQWDIRGNAHGLLSTHPITPFVSVHHVEAVDPFYPGLSSLESLKLFTRAMEADPTSMLQRSICYDYSRRLTFSISLGYVVQVFPKIVLPRELERSEHTYSAWNRISHRNEFDFDTREPYRSICTKPVLFFMKDIGKKGNHTLGKYGRATGKDDLKRKVFCFPRSPPLPNVQNILVLGHPVSKNWHLVPRRLCCTLNDINDTSDTNITLTVGQCEKGAFSSVATA